jgi:AraC-like DNA-binding protein
MSARAADTVQVQARGGAVQSLYEHGLTWVSFKPMPDFACGIDFTLLKLPDLGLLSGTVQGVRHEHARRDSGDGNDDFSFHMNLAGLSFVSGRLGETTLGDGDAMLLSYSVSRTISRPELVDHRVIRLPRGTGMLSLLRSYVDAVFDDPALAVPELRRLIVAQLCDLVAVTLGATRDATAVAEGRGIRAARLRAIKDDIEEHLARGDLSPGAVAKRQKVSDSYIRKLFGTEGTSFSQFVPGRRLARAHRMLTDPRWTGRSIASIALEASFGGLSYFNRTFKRFYGATPSEVRDAVDRHWERENN